MYGLNKLEPMFVAFTAYHIVGALQSTPAVFYANLQQSAYSNIVINLLIMSIFFQFSRNHPRGAAVRRRSSGAGPLQDDDDRGIVHAHRGKVRFHSRLCDNIMQL